MNDQDVAVIGLSCSYSGKKDIIQFWMDIFNGECPFDSIQEDSFTKGDDGVFDKHLYEAKVRIIEQALSEAMVDANILEDDLLRNATDLIFAGTDHLDRESIDRIANQFNLKGYIGFSERNEKNSLLLIELALNRLRDKISDVVVVGEIGRAVDSNASLDLNRPSHKKGKSHYPKIFTGLVVLMRKEDVLNSKRQAYAVIKGTVNKITFPLRNDGAFSQDEAMGDTKKASINSNNIQQDIGYLDILENGLSNLHESKENALKSLIRKNDHDAWRCPINWIDGVGPQTLFSTGIGLFIKLILVISNKIVPPNLILHADL